MTMKRNNSIKRNENLFCAEEEIGGDLWKQANEASQKWRQEMVQESQMPNQWIWLFGPFWLEEDDSPGQHKLMKKSPQMIYVTLLRPCISLQTFLYLGNILTIKAIQSAYEFKRTWPFFEKQFFSLQCKVFEPSPIFEHIKYPQKTGLKNQPQPTFLGVKVLGVLMEISQLTDSSTFGLFSLHAFQADCFLMG